MKRPTEAFIRASLFELGLGHVAVARFRTSGETEIGVFLVDTQCLGVKDAFYTCADESEYDRELLDKILPAADRKPLDPPSARKLVEGAVAYAQNLGFAPHPDYKKACRVFGGVNPVESTATFTYGKDGKPFYIQGRYDSFEKCLRILKALRTRCGDDNFHFLTYCNEAQSEELERNGFKIRQKVPCPPDL